MITALQLAAKVTADTSDAQKNLRDFKGAADDASGESGGGGIKGFVTHVAEMVTSLAIFDAAREGVHLLVDQVKDAVNAAGQYEIIQSQTVQGLKSTRDASGMTAQSIQDLAEKYSTLTTFSRDNIQQAENITLTFTNIGKSVFPQATMAALDMSQRLGMDLPNATMMLDKALQDPIKGITALRRVGIDLSKEQEDQIKHFMAVGDVADAQKIILGEVNKEMGGSAQAAGQTFAGALQILQNQLEDTKEKVGAALIPVLTQLLTIIGPLLAGFADFTGQALGGLTSFITSDVIPTIQQWAPVLGVIVNAAQMLGNVFTNALKPALMEIEMHFAFTKSKGDPVKQVIGDITGVVQKLTPIVREAGQIVGQLAAWFVTQALPAIQRFAGFVMTNVMPILGQLGGFILNTVVPALSQLGGFIMSNVVPAVGQIVTWVGQKVMPVLTQVGQIVLQNVVPALEGMWTTISSQLIPAVENLWNKISPVLIPVFQFLAGPVLNGLVVPAFRFTWTVISGVITVFGDLVGAIGWVLGKLGNLKDFLGGELSNAWNALGGLVSGIWTGIGDSVKGGIDGLISIINGLISAIDNIHVNIPSVGPFGGGSIGFNIPQIPYLAEGGDVQDEGAFVVGDKGPEIMSGKKGARVTPLAAGLAGVGGGGQSGPIEVTVNLVADGLRLAQTVVRHMPEAVRNATGQRGM